MYNFQTHDCQSLFSVLSCFQNYCVMSFQKSEMQLLSRKGMILYKKYWFTCTQFLFRRYRQSCQARSACALAWPFCICSLVEKLKDVDWHGKINSLIDKLRPWALKAGRVAAKPLLQFYYVMADEKTSTLDKKPLLSSSCSVFISLKCIGYM